MSEVVRKNIEIKGIAFPNKGAELLLITIIQKIGSRHNICLEPNGDYSNKVNYPIYTKTCLRIKGINIIFCLTLLPKFIRRRLGFVNQSEVDVVLDASGFAYGDEWGRDIARNRILKEKSPIIFLPQTFGEFNHRVSKKTIRQAVGKSILMYAREEKSKREIEKTTQKKIAVVRDITFGYVVEKNSIARDFIIIPNFQVYEREGEGYINKILKIIEDNSERKITFINHEGIKDKKIIEKITSQSKSKCEVINDLNGSEIKSIIGNSKIVITSRYHGLVSALSQKIPVIALGWSFKYRELLEFFSIKYVDETEEINTLIRSKYYTDYFASEEYSEKLKNIKDQLNGMWCEIEQKISEN